MKKKLILSYTLIAIIILSACSSKKETENNTNAKENTAKETGTPVTATTNSNEKATVFFKVNNVEANTKMGGSNDNATQLGFLTAKTIISDLL